MIIMEEMLVGMSGKTPWGYYRRSEFAAAFQGTATELERETQRYDAGREGKEMMRLCSAEKELLVGLPD